MKSSGCLLLLLASWLAAPAFAHIDVTPKLAVVQGKPASVHIVNQGDRAEYVSVTLSRLLNPGVEPEQERLEPVVQTEQPALYVYPFKLSLGSGQSKTITLKPLAEVDQEQVYRLDIKPLVNLLDRAGQGTTGNVVVTLAFSTLVRLLPPSETSELSLRCEPEGAWLAASGNVRYQVKDAVVDGRPVDPFNVYPGTPILLKGRAILVPGQPSCPPSGR
ncbi:hypothetical protein AXYL_01035 [Achromobacter xylosoxidans A8]|uniref:Pili assembly chaperone N-terminal domain-containing protein n=1 Tax=Achromobacter xylosoxidans (strain A8) TaxID=762376 RepID=E3HJQ6_ACHXA|nr:hypothetical protein [Achromobacter xylosoxidans]ADP14381.1 hypothetical protein AXYL_01035 [Achromobacter xylosoxidans A8]